MTNKNKTKQCKHGLPLFQTCRSCNRIMVKDSWGKGFSKVVREVLKKVKL